MTEGTGAGVSDQEAQKAGAPPGYDALVEGAAAYRDGSRRVFRVGGDRAPDMLQGLVTADIRVPGGGAAWPTLILTPKGRVLADAVVMRVADELLLDVPEAAWPGLEPHFARYLPPRFAKLEPAELQVVRVRGPRATGLTAVGLPAAARTERDGLRQSAAAVGDGFVIRVDGVAAGGPGIDVYWPAASDLSGAFDARDQAAARVAAVSEEAWEIWRIERGIPLYGIDVSEDNLPQETGLVADSTSFSKGCYTGQEVLARIHYRGRVNRHLRGLRLVEGRGEHTAGGVLEPGQELTRDGRRVGEVTSAVVSPRFGAIGLGYVRREVEPGEHVDVGSDDASTRAVVVNPPFTGGADGADGGH